VADVGGKDVAETTRRMMRSMMTNGVALKMNFAERRASVT